MSLKHWMILPCTTALTLAGCVTSNVEASADILLTGTLLQEDKQPLANVLATLDRGPDSACLFTPFGAGWKSVKTGSDGTFRQELLGADTQNGSVARCFSLRTPARDKGGLASVSFLVQLEEVKLPTLQQWGGAVTVSPGTGEVSIHYKSLSDTHEGTSGNEHAFELTTGTARDAWRLAKVSSPVRLSDYVLEDAAGPKGYFTTGHSVKGSGTTFQLFYRSDAAELPTRNLVPASRGASCSYPNAPTPCPLTNGDLGDIVLFEEGTRELVVTLSTPKTLRKAVLRHFETVFGQPTEAVLEGSPDGSTWVPLANLLSGQSVPPFAEVDLNPSAGALSQVRLRTTSQDNSFRIRSLSELSLFE